MTSEDNVIKDLFSEEGSRKVLSIYWTFLVVILIYHATVFWVIMQDDIQSKNDQPSFSISFDEFSDISTESRTINDGEESVIQYTAQPEMFDSHSGFGMLYVNISYTETSGEIADPCDTVSADLTPTGATADWNNPNNDLSGVSSDCETISLVLHIFPEYSGDNYNVIGGTVQNWINSWTDSSHGEGTFNLEVEVIVNGPVTSGIPTVSDTDEEVTVTWEAVFFDVSALEV
tara:strand:+ start:2390 stop:3082 length:693 start_codon:yes stop_codon:yes gene_type:complete